MALIDPADVSNLIEATVRPQPPEIVAQRLNEGIGQGFSWGSPLSAVVLIIGVWS